MSATPAALEVRDLTVRFGGVTALNAVSFDVNKGDVCALIGPNGAGKTTAFNCLSRLITPDAGSVRFEGTDLLAVPAHRVARLGIGRTFQELALFSRLSVLDNVLVATHAATKAGWGAGAVRSRRSVREERATRRRAGDLLTLLELEAYADRPAAGLPYATLKRIELARALAAGPRLLLLDEPASGLTPGELDAFAQVITSLRDALSLSILLIEHRMSLVMEISDQVVVLAQGQQLAAGTPAAIRQNPVVIGAYLGAPA